MFSTVIRVVLLTIASQMATITTRVTCSLDGLFHQATALEVGIMMALFAFIPALFSIQIGQWVDRVGAKWPIFVGLSLISISISVPLLFPADTFGLIPLYASCSINGLGMIFTVITCQQLVGHVSNAKNRTNNFAIMAMGYSSASLLAPIATGWFIDHIGHQSAYQFGFGCVALGFLLYLAFQSIIPRSWNRPQRQGRSSSWELFKIPHVRNVLIASSFMSMAWDLQSFMIPVYGTSIGLSASEVGWLLGAFSGATFFVRLLMPMIAKRLTEWRIIACAFGFGTLAYCLFPLFENFYLLMGVTFLLGMALGASQPNVMSLLHTETPPGRQGEAIGLRTMLINVCHTILPLVFGAAGAVIGAGAVFYVVSALMGGVTVFTSKCQKQSQEVLNEHG